MALHKIKNYYETIKRIVQNLFPDRKREGNEKIHYKMDKKELP